MSDVTPFSSRPPSSAQSAPQPGRPDAVALGAVVRKDDLQRERHLFHAMVELLSRTSGRDDVAWDAQTVARLGSLDRAVDGVAHVADDLSRRLLTIEHDLAELVTILETSFAQTASPQATTGSDTITHRWWRPVLIGAAVLLASLGLAASVALYGTR